MVRQVERLKAERLDQIATPKRKKVAYVEINENDQESNVVYEYVEENNINLEKLQPWPPYVCKVLRASNGKNHVEPSKNKKFIIKTYTFDVTKCD